jgi:hypothetical protein
MPLKNQQWNAHSTLYQKSFQHWKGQHEIKSNDQADCAEDYEVVLCHCHILAVVTVAVQAAFRVIACEELSAVMDAWGNTRGLTTASLAPLAIRRHCDKIYIRPALACPTGKLTR